jgi:hypothetical protein
VLWLDGAGAEVAAAGGLTATLDADCEVLRLDEAGAEVADGVAEIAAMSGKALL